MSKKVRKKKRKSLTTAQESRHLGKTDWVFMGTQEFIRGIEKGSLQTEDLNIQKIILKAGKFYTSQAESSYPTNSSLLNTGKNSISTCFDFRNWRMCSYMQWNDPTRAPTAAFESSVQTLQSSTMKQQALLQAKPEVLTRTKGETLKLRSHPTSPARMRKGWGRREQSRTAHLFQEGSFSGSCRCFPQRTSQLQKLAMALLPDKLGLPIPLKI